MSDANNDADEPEQQDEPPMTPVGLDPREIAEIAKLTDLLNRRGVAVTTYNRITPLDYGLVFDVSLYIQTRSVPEDAEEALETDRAPDAGEVEVDPDAEVVVEDREADDDDE